MQQQQGECCRGELCQCSINAHLNLREFSGNAASITLHQNTFQSAWSTMSNTCHWLLRPLSRGKACAGQLEPAPPPRFGVKCQDVAHLSLRQKEPQSDLSRSLAPFQRVTVMNALLMSDLFDQTWVPAVRSKSLTHLFPQSRQAQLPCYWEHRDWGDSGRLQS